jgi:hypothetical protein
MQLRPYLGSYLFGRSYHGNQYNRRYPGFNAPKLIPIYSHRYIPEKPNESGNPILSVYQTDIIYYGANLLEYFENEFRRKGTKLEIDSRIKEIEFWSEIINQS